MGASKVAKSQEERHKGGEVDSMREVEWGGKDEGEDVERGRIEFAEGVCMLESAERPRARQQQAKEGRRRGRAEERRDVRELVC